MFGHELCTPVDLPPQYVHNLQERLWVVHELTRQGLADAGSCQKQAYDSRCRELCFWRSSVGLQSRVKKGLLPQADEPVGWTLYST